MGLLRLPMLCAKGQLSNTISSPALLGSLLFPNTAPLRLALWVYLLVSKTRHQGPAASILKGALFIKNAKTRLNRVNTLVYLKCYTKKLSFLGTDAICIHHYTIILTPVNNIKS